MYHLSSRSFISLNFTFNFIYVDLPTLRVCVCFLAIEVVPGFHFVGSFITTTSHLNETSKCN